MGTQDESAPALTTAGVRAEIERRVSEKLAPVHLEVRDDSAEHSGHPGLLAQGGGHFRILCVSAAFEGKSLIDQHRMIHGAVDYPMDGAIHALEIKTIPPSRWTS